MVAPALSRERQQMSGPLARRHAATDHGGPSGSTIVLVHGFGCDQGMWDLVVPLLVEHHRVVTLDLVGAGRSDLTAYDEVRHASLSGYAEDVAAVLTELAFADCVVVGHSVASMIGALAHGLAPDSFCGLVMLGPSPRYTNVGDYVGGFTEADIDSLLETLDANYLGWSSAMAPVVMGNADRPALASRLNRSFCQTDPAIASRFARATFLADNRADLRDVRVPTLVLQCTEDAIANEVVGQFVADSIPDARFQQLAATGHCPHVSAPEEVATAVLAFVSTAGR